MNTAINENRALILLKGDISRAMSKWIISAPSTIASETRPLCVFTGTVTFQPQSSKVFTVGGPNAFSAYGVVKTKQICIKHKISLLTK